MTERRKKHVPNLGKANTHTHTTHTTHTHTHFMPFQETFGFMSEAKWADK